MIKTKTNITSRVLAVLWSLLCIVPLLVVILGSFKTSSEIMLGPFVLPASWDFHNYTTAFSLGNVIGGICNSFFYGIVSVAIILALSSMAAYVLSRYKNKLVNFVYLFFMIGVLVPIHATFIPLFSTVTKMGMYDSRLTMIIIYVTFNLPLSILIMTGYMKGITREIDEAAKIDGCTTFKTFYKIILPLVAPAAATCGIISFINVYNDIIMANLFLSDTSKQTVTQVINAFSGQYNSDMGATFAALVAAILPMILIYMCFQERVINGLASGAVKG